MGNGALALLTGVDAEGLLAAAVATAGGRLAGWRVTQVDHRPGRSTTVAYAATVAWPDGERAEILGASCGIDTDRDAPGVVVLSDGAADVAVWRFPADPELAALPTAADPAAVGALLAGGGVGIEPVVVTGVTPRSYRPRRRAVLEVSTSRGRVYAKVVRPERVADLHTRHRVLTEAGVPVPAPLGWREDGLLLLRALPGRSLRDELRTAGTGALPPAELVGLLDSLPDALLSLPRRHSWTEDAAHYARVVGTALPREAARAVDLARAVEQGLGSADEPVVPAHGDFYEAQLLVHGGRVTGLLDVDAAGPGHRSDDLGCFLAHAQVLVQVYPAEADRLREALAGWLRGFDADPRTSPRALRLRTAGVLLSLATGPHRVQEPGWPETTARRLDMVEEWLGRADAGS